MGKIKILWADDEIDLLKPHVLFLEEKGYEVITSNNGGEAMDIINEENIDILFLDENMPGISGLETLARIRVTHPNLPVVMITKNDQEVAMDDAIGSNTSDYLIKPVNPNQILLCLKKNLENKRLVSERTTHNYQQEFRKISLDITGWMKPSEWIDVYKKLVYWELELDKSGDTAMYEVLLAQKQDANLSFCKYYESHYKNWLTGKAGDVPILSHTVLRERLIPKLQDDRPVFLLVLDNLRYDQWKVIQPVIEEYYRVQEDHVYYSIIPSATQYARNALFGGLLPSEIEKKYPKYWIQEAEEGTKNQFEAELFGEFMKRFGRDEKWEYHKLLNLGAAKKFLDNLPNIMNNKINIMVYNFVDMLSHARTDTEVVRELADNESAYRSVTLTWLKHSPLLEIIQYLAEHNVNLFITTDHGSVKVDYPVRIIADKDVNLNLRYKFGKQLEYNKKEVFEVRDPQEIFVPKLKVTTSYVFCRSSGYFVYPTNYNHYVNYYKNTFQHGGISMEEILIPFIFLKAK